MKNRKSSEINRNILQLIGPFNLTLISFFAAIAGQYFIYIRKMTGGGLLFFGIALVIFILADLINPDRSSILARFPLKQKQEASAPGTKTEIIIFLLIMAVAAFFRFYQLGEMPIGIHRDEAKAAMDALDILNNRRPLGGDSKLPVYISVLTDNPAFYNYIITAFFKFLGSGIIEARIASAFIGMLTVAAFYFLLRYLFGSGLAAIGAFLFAVMRWHACFSRFIYHAGFSVFFLILVFYFAYRMYNERRLIDFIFFGAALALSQYTYQASKAVVPAFFIAAVYLMIRDFAFYRKNFKKILLALGVFLILMAPLISYFSANKNFGNRASLLYVFSKPNMDRFNGTKTPAVQYLENVKKVWLMFNKEGDINIVYNLPKKPMLDFFTGALAAMGFGYLLYRAIALSSFAGITMLLFLAFMQTVTFFIDAPHAARSIMTLPFPIIFGVVYVDRAYSHLKFQGGPALKKIMIAIFLLLLGAAGYNNYKALFNEYARTPYLWQGFDAETVKAVEYLSELGPKWHGVFPYNYLDMDESGYNYLQIDLVLSKQKGVSYESFLMGKNFPLPVSAGNTAYILPANYVSLVSFMKEAYPRGEYVPVYRKYEPEKLSHFIFKVPQEEAAAYRPHRLKNGLTGRYYNNAEFKGPAALKRVDPFIFFFWKGQPSPVETPDFSAVWTGKIKIDKAGTYNFVIFTFDNYELYLDNRQVLVNRGEKYDGRATLNLSEGMHPIKIKYQPTKRRKIEFMWSKPGPWDLQPVPVEALYPE